MATRLLTRRDAIRCIAGLSLAVLPFACSRIGEQTHYLSAYKRSDNHFGLRILDSEFSLLSDQQTPGRGHSIAISSDGDTVVAVARRPGTYLTTYNKRNDSFHSIQSKAGRHFYGHACFSRDSRLLFTTENDFDNGRGVIGVRDVQNGFKQIAEWSSHDIGPHELVLMSDNRTLAIAVGGIQTHPDSGREKLNLSTMKSGVVFLDTRNGQLIAKHNLAEEYRLLSIRHLTEAQNGTLCLAMQYQGSRFDTVPLVGFSSQRDGIDMCFAEEATQRRMRNYCGAVACDRSGQLAAISSPRGGIVTFWDVNRRNCIGSIALRDCCGVASTPRAGQFAVSSGSGESRLVSVRGVGDITVDAKFYSDAHWDNHLTSFVV